jgi:hypothetical protein
MYSVVEVIGVFFIYVAVERSKIPQERVELRLLQNLTVLFKSQSFVFGC